MESGVEYRAIAGFPGYRVGSDGTVWTSLKRFGLVFVAGGSWRKMSGGGGSRGYQMVRLRAADMTRKNRAVHHLVLEAFVGSRPVGMEGCHYDRNRANNAVSNLRWDTRKANHADKIRHGTSGRGERSAGAVLSNKTVLEIAEDIRAGTGLQVVAEKYGISMPSVWSIRRGGTWGWLTGATAANPLGVYGRNKRKLDTEKVARIKRLLLDGVNCRAVAAMFGVHENTVRGILVGARWANVEPVAC